MAKNEYKPELVAIGQRIATGRKRDGINLTQEGLSKKIYISKSFISEIEGGKSAASGLIYLKIADAIDVPIQWILKGEDPISTDGQTSTVTIPLELSQIADSEGWSYDDTLDVATALNSVIARRTSSGRFIKITKEHILTISKALGIGKNEESKSN